MIRDKDVVKCRAINFDHVLTKEGELLWLMLVVAMANRAMSDEEVVCRTRETRHLGHHGNCTKPDRRVLQWKNCPVLVAMATAMSDERSGL